MRSRFLLILTLLLVLPPRTSLAQVWDKGPMELKASRIRVKNPWELRSLMPRWGLPETKNETEAERISHKGKLWMSTKGNSKAINWMAWDMDPADGPEQKKTFLATLDTLGWKYTRQNWDAAFEEATKWSWEKPHGGTSIACGPLWAKGKVYAYFLVVCKRTTGSLGYKSLAFELPATDNAANFNLIDQSCSVNIVEYKSGINFFPKLPSQLQEMVEEMTAYELYCPFVEEEDRPFDTLREMIEDAFDQDVLGELPYE